jgi:hypothetical protein
MNAPFVWECSAIVKQNADAMQLDRRGLMEHDRAKERLCNIVISGRIG